MKDRPSASSLDLASAYFAQTEPEELLYDEIETIWAAIATHDDWTVLDRKLAGVAQARDAYGLASGQDSAVRRSQA